MKELLLKTMHNAPYTEKQQDDPAPQAAAGPLPLRKEAPNELACYAPQKDLMTETTGGKVTNGLINDGLGFGGNAALSIAITYGVNPTPGAKMVREKTLAGAQRLFKNFLPQPAISNVVDIGFMLIAGTILTSIMAPLVNRREKIAHWMNKKLGKDQDVLPEDQRVYGTPHTLEDKIEIELKKRVKYSQTSRDLWKARWSAIWVPVFGDMALGKVSAEREAQTPGKWSVDTVSWKTGQHLYNDVLPKNWVSKMGNFFKSHSAGIEDVKKNNRPIYDRLMKVEEQHEKINTLVHGKDPVTPEMQADRMMIADQTRLLGKEVGWTLILSQIVERLTTRYQHRRIRREENRAFAKMREEGIIPAGVSIETDKQGHVSLTTLKNYVPAAERAAAETIASAMQNNQWAGDKVKSVTQAPEESSVERTKNWADDMVKSVTATRQEKAANHKSMVDKSRSDNQQTSLA